jgi:hypothetical protein
LYFGTSFNFALDQSGVALQTFWWFGAFVGFGGGSGGGSKDTGESGGGGGRRSRSDECCDEQKGVHVGGDPYFTDIRFRTHKVNFAFG